MNFSTIKPSVYHYLSYRKMPCDPSIDSMICECLDELERMDSFKFLYAEYDELLDFLHAEPYASFLTGSDGYFLLACTLGIEVDRVIRCLSLTDMTKMIIFDASANAFLEYMAETHKKQLGEKLSYIFCPGYAGSSVDDLKFIFRELDLKRIGMELNESNLIIPQKSMVGIVGKGISPQMRCDGCIKEKNCFFRKEGRLCYRSEQN
ncbi:MAG: hypothetical protein UH851_02750 [Clostridia bacterium]|nr:hypothetical protein [Clostridia bacterium]